MMPDLRVLTLTHFGETSKEDAKITLAACHIKMTSAQESTVQDRPINITTIYFLDDPETVTLNLSALDLLQLESVVGGYGIFEG
jgi:hypothetical protein